MANFLGPYWVLLNSHSALGLHSNILPTRAWNPDGGFGTFESWDSGAPAADTMIEGLVNVLKCAFNSDYAFDNWVIYKQLLPTDRPQPVMSANLTGAVGGGVTGGWAGATEIIITARTESFGIAKLTLLDPEIDNDYAPVSGVLTGLYLDIFNEWSDVSNAWSGRDNARPATFLKMTKNLNQKLRKEYHYT